MRLLSPSALLYTEMITARALLHGDADRLLAFDPAEQPVALQLGGSEPHELAAAAKLGEAAGYREINLNCGCPSDRVQNGRFGACLMGEAERVRDGVASMLDAVSVPVTVKCRIGIEPGVRNGYEYEFLQNFVRTVADGGCRIFIVHARLAVLAGLSPKQNREIPPLRFDLVQRLRRDFPELTLVVNGGIRTLNEVERQLSSFDGVMIGREAYQNPYLLAELHRRFCEPEAQLPRRANVLHQYAQYVGKQVLEGQRSASMVRHVLGLYAGLPSVRAWRRFLSEGCGDPASSPRVLLDSLRIVEQPGH
jgi:tRNA-dihydrouridine synthase A